MIKNKRAILCYFGNMHQISFNLIIQHSNVIRNLHLYITQKKKTFFKFLFAVQLATVRLFFDQVISSFFSQIGQSKNRCAAAFSQNDHKNNIM